MSPRVRRLRAWLARSPLRLPLVWVRHATLAPADVAVASFPRAGNTWLRMMLFGLLADAPGAPRSEVLRGAPYVGRQGTAPRLLPGGGRLVKTHERYSRRYRRAVYLVRDPRDSLVSAFHFERNLGRATDLEDFAEDFLAGRFGPYGRWDRHVEGWLDSPAATATLVVRYERLREEVTPTLEDILDFLGCPRPAPAIAAVVEATSLREMRTAAAAEDQGGPVDLVARRGVAGSWRDELPSHLAARVQETFGPTMARLGYD